MKSLIIILSDLGLSLILLFPTMIIHELGHYVLAKRQGIYKSWGFFNSYRKGWTKYIPVPHIEVNGYFKKKWHYLSGILLSLITIPLWLYFDYSIYFVLFLLIVAGWKDIKFSITKKEEDAITAK